MNAEDVKRLLGLRPHPREGGWYVRAYEAAEFVAAEGFQDGRYDSARRTSTAIYYLLEPDTFSEMHALRSDEIFHFYAGDAVEMLQLLADGSSKRVVIGSDLANGQLPQVVVPRDVWQGSRLVEGGTWALLGCTVSPGFEFEDYAEGERAALLKGWPDAGDLIAALTRRAE